MDWNKFLIKLKNPTSNSHKMFNNFYEHKSKKLFLSNSIRLHLINNMKVDHKLLFEELFDKINKEFNVYKSCETLYLEFDYNYFPTCLDNFNNLKKFYFKGKNYNKFSIGMLPESIEHIDIKNLELDEKTFYNSSKLVNLKVLELNLHQIINHKSIIQQNENILEIKNRNCITIDGIQKLTKIILHFEYYFIDGELYFSKWLRFIKSSSIFVNIIDRIDEIKLGKDVDKIYSQYIEIIVNNIILSKQTICN